MLFSSSVQCDDVAKVAAQIVSNSAAVKTDIARAALPDPAAQRRPTDDELTIIAFIVSRANPKRIPIDSLVPFRNFLSTRDDINRLCLKLSEMLYINAGQISQFFASKHLIGSSRLEEKREIVLNALDKILNDLKEINIKAVVCYGTLLGAERSNSFIPHDDDVDVLYFDGSRSESEARMNAKNVIEKLNALGYATSMCGFNFHVQIDGAEIDLFPSWEIDDQIFLMMERYRFRSLSKSMIWPAGEVLLYDRTYPAPSDRTAFLHERYGDRWQTPDPFFEWPWPLSSLHTIEKQSQEDRSDMPTGFDQFLSEVAQRSPVMEYVWTREKEVSCEWMLSQIRGGAGVDVGGTEYLCRKLISKGVDVTYYDLFAPTGEIKHVKDDMINVLNHFEERSLDFITTRHTLEHSLVPLFQLWAYNRLLKDDGKLFVIVPAHHRDWVWFGTHHNCLPHDNWVMLFHRAGFKVEISDAGTWKPWDPKYIEYRFRLSVDSRELRL